jgi:hypothetical protein
MIPFVTRPIHKLLRVARATSGGVLSGGREGALLVAFARRRLSETFAPADCFGNTRQYEDSSMRHVFIVATVLTAISFTPLSARANIFGLFGFDCCGGHNCGCGSCGSCGNCCEPCCGCEPGCGCEPTCGCGTGCFANRPHYGGQTFHCGCKGYVPICPCTGCDSGCCNEGCGNCCEPACGCGDCGSCCEPCGCGSECGSCCDSCRPRQCCLKHCGFCCGCGRVLSALCCFCPCGGCSGETYWSEWHNDPPRCQDPCNCHGDWIGPGGCSSCGPNGGACGCEGGCVGAQTNNTGRPAPAYARTNNMNRSAAVARHTNSNQQSAGRTTNQTRVASRPMTNNQQQRPIQW